MRQYRPLQQISVIYTSFMKKIPVLLLLLNVVFPSAAQQLRYGNNIAITHPVNENLYLAGGSITINAPIHGDLTVAGGTVVINDTVSNDLLILGGEVTVNGYTGGDVRCLGGKIFIGGNIAGDLVLSGGEIVLEKKAVVGNLLGVSGNITVDGVVNGNVNGRFGSFVLNGTVQKDMDCRGGNLSINGLAGGKSILAADKITIGEKAIFTGDVRYWTRYGMLETGKMVHPGKAIYDSSLRIRSGEWYYLGAATVLGLLWYLGMALLMIMIVQYLFKSTMRKAADTVFSRSLKSLGNGIIFFIAVPLGAAIACITIIGVPVGLLLFSCYLVLLLLASVITAVVGANWFNNRYRYGWHYWQMAFTALGIFIILKITVSISFIGPLLIMVLACISFGAILMNINWKRKQPALID